MEIVENNSKEFIEIKNIGTQHFICAVSKTNKNHWEILLDLGKDTFRWQHIKTRYLEQIKTWNDIKNSIIVQMDSFNFYAFDSNLEMMEFIVNQNKK